MNYLSTFFNAYMKIRKFKNYSSVIKICKTRWRSSFKGIAKKTQKEKESVFGTKVVTFFLGKCSFFCNLQIAKFFQNFAICKFQVLVIASLNLIKKKKKILKRNSLFLLILFVNKVKIKKSVNFFFS